MINPASLAFDIDGVCADTMSLFLDIARDEYHINHIRYQDITSYRLEDCLNIDSATIDDIVINYQQQPFDFSANGIPVIFTMASSVTG